MVIRRRDGVPVVPEGTLLSGRYRIQRTLGQGGMGTVYAALDESLDRSVALKLLPTSLADDASRGRRFLREAREITVFSVVIDVLKFEAIE